MRRELHIDYETRSRADIRKVGAIRYTEDPSFMVLMAAWAFDDEPVQQWDYTEGEMPAELRDALHDPDVLHFAHNANFELAATRAHTGTLPNPDDWRCTAVWGASLGLPRSLDGMSKALKLSTEKDSEGARLIRFFSIPISAGKRKGEFRDPADHPEEWAKYKAYNRQDVEVERAIHRKIASRPMLDQEWELWALDQRINFTGLRIDRTLAENAVRIDAAQVAERSARLREVTGLENPNSVQQLTEWLESQDLRFDNLRKETVEAMVDELKDSPGYEEAREALKLRLANSEKSTSKYEAMLRTASKSDDRVRGLFQFYGADTGRWAGRLVQVQNLPRGGDTLIAELRRLGYDLDALSKDEVEKLLPIALDSLRERLRAGDGALTSADLKGLIRTAFVPAPGHVFLQADFAAIEARVLAWLAGETWALEAFATHGKIYEATAAAMLGKPIDEVTKDDRQRGKVAVLALGYQGAVGALLKMGAVNMGIPEKDLPGIVAQWRRANAKIVKLWRAYQLAATNLTHHSGKRRFGAVSFEKSRGGTLYVTLPSGRQLAYPAFRTETDADGRDRLSYTRSVGANVVREDTYGGKLTENIVQAVARDLLAEAMLNLDVLGYRIVATIHDEVLIEAPLGSDVDSIIAPMTTLPAWAAGLPLDAAGEVMTYFHK